MSGDLNPFEPWRPPEDRPFPNLETDSPQVEPVPESAPPDRASNPPRPGWSLEDEPAPPEEGWSPPCPSSMTWGDAPRTRLPVEHKILLVLIPGLFVGAVFTLALLGLPHISRVVLAAVALGVGAGEILVRRRRWWVSLGWVLLTLAAAGLVWVFVPTAGGISLWEAHRRLAQLQALPAGDFQAYEETALERKKLIDEFPTFAQDVAAAEQAWLHRTMDEALQAAQKRDPDLAWDSLHHLDQGLVQTLRGFDPFAKEFAYARWYVWNAQSQVLGERLDKAEKEVDALLAGKEWDRAAHRARSLATQLEQDASSVEEEDKQRSIDRPLTSEVRQRMGAVQQRVLLARREALRAR